MIYIVEDDLNIRQMESYALKNSGYLTEEFDDGVSFFAACEKKLPDLILLDIMLPGDDGLKILQTLKANQRTRFIPVILITAKTTELDTVKGLDLGADDYIAKPFGIMEFISRVKAVLRRTSSSGDGVLALGQIQMDDQKRQVWSESRLCELTYKEYELLKFFLQNPGIVLSREKLINRVWCIDYEGESRTVDMHVKTLRQKLGSQGALIKTVRNVGYKIEV